MELRERRDADETDRRRGSGEPHHHNHYDQVLSHNDCPKESTPGVDADADQTGVTERASEIAGDWNTAVGTAFVHHFLPGGSL